MGSIFVDIPWRLRIGDPTLLGWLITIAYFTAAVAAAVTAVKAGQQPVPEHRRPRRVWWLVAALLFALALNKQMDLQSLLTAIGRSVARHQGWYAKRRTVQLWFVVFACGGTVLGLGLGWHALGRFWRDEWLLFSALVLTAVFVIARIASFHHVDRLLGMRVGDARVAQALELTAIVLFLCAALSALRRMYHPAAPDRGGPAAVNRCRNAGRTPSPTDTAAD